MGPRTRLWGWLMYSILSPVPSPKQCYSWSFITHWNFNVSFKLATCGIQMVPFITPHHFTPLPPVCSLCGTPTLAALWGALAPLPAVQKWGPGLGRSVLSQGIVMSASPSIRLSEVLSPPRQRISAAPQSLPSRPCSCGFSSVELQRSFRGDCQPGATF